MSKPSLIAAVQYSTKASPATLDQLWTDHAQQWHDLGWNRDQLSLWLACSPLLQRCILPNGDVGWSLNSAQGHGTLNLADELVGLLKKAGRPMPLALLISKLPPGTVVTEPMLRSAAQDDVRLEVIGPLLKLV